MLHRAVTDPFPDKCQSHARLQFVSWFAITPLNRSRRSQLLSLFHLHSEHTLCRCGSAWTDEDRSRCAICSSIEAGNTNKRGMNAREEDTRTCAQGKARRQSADDAGRRVRPRGNRARTAWQTRGAINETGHRDRSFQGAPRRSHTQAAEKGTDIGSHSQECRTRLSRRAKGSATTVRASVASDLTSAEAQTQARRIDTSPFKTRSFSHPSSSTHVGLM